jgi:hypothetical protein
MFVLKWLNKAVVCGQSLLFSFLISHVLTRGIVFFCYVIALVVYDYRSAI